MDRTYRLKQCANKGKQAAAIQTILAYRVTAASIARYQWRRFYESAQPFNKQYDIKLLASAMSERFKQTCQYQVVGTLTSFIATDRTILSAMSTAAVSTLTASADSLSSTSTDYGTTGILSL